MYRLIDQYKSGYIDVRIGKTTIAELQTISSGYILSFSIDIELADMAAVKQWISSHINEMQSLIKAAGW